MAWRPVGSVRDHIRRAIFIPMPLALDADGKFALRADLAKTSAPTRFLSPLSTAPAVTVGLRVSQLRADTCVLTNTVPTGPYRGAGRPEAMHTIERLIDMAAVKPVSTVLNYAVET